LLPSAVLRRRRRPPLSIDTFSPRGAQRQTRRRTPQPQSNDGTDRQTDGRTPDRYIDPAAHAAQAGSINKAFSIGVNAARVAGVATPAPPPKKKYLTCRSRPVLTTAQYFG